MVKINIIITFIVIKSARINLYGYLIDNFKDYMIVYKNDK